MSLEAPVDSPAAEDHEFVEEVVARAVEHVLLGQCHRHAEGASARDDRHLVQRVRVLKEKLQKGMARLVPGGRLVFFAGESGALALAAPEHLVARLFEDGVGNRLQVAARGEEGGHVDDVREVGA